MTSVLAVDVGNSRVKWGVNKDHQWIAKGQLAHHEIEMLISHWDELKNISYVIASTVSNHLITNQLNCIFASFGFKVHWIASRSYQCGLKNSYNYLQLGSDRWAAMIAAWNKFHDSCLVVNIGTAMTVDTISRNGVFLGGYIVPGPFLQLQSLKFNTQINYVTPARYEFFPTTTSSAVHCGIVIALTAMIDKSFQLFYKHQGYQVQNCILSGGGVELIQSHIEFPFVEIDNLVLDGLIVIADDIFQSDPK
ncbi:MAG: type III pantothenate kinase [Nitrosomonas sp.]|nr:type III pantothenate kinase [Nitrosomonas sp.]MCW5606915.1 type III pantothenate kinase [Nitrosomonas sp.]